MATSEEGLQAEIGITLGKLQRQMAQAEARMVKATKKIEQTGGRATRSVEQGFVRAGKSANNFAAGGGMRNVSMQLSQIAQQGAVTGNYMQALSFQLPDLAMGFGTVGIAIGALGAVLGPMAADFLLSGENARTLEETVSDLSSAVGAYQNAVERAATPTAKLREEYGEAAGKARELFEAQKQLTELNALGALRDAQSAIVNQFGSMAGIDEQFARNYGLAVEAIDRLNNPPTNAQGVVTLSDAELAENNKQIRRLQEVVDQVRPAIARVKDELHLTDAAAGELLAAMVRLRDAKGIETQGAALAEVRDLMLQAVQSSGELTESQEAMIRSIIDANLATLDMTASMDGAAASTATAANNASRLADEIARAAGNAMTLAAQSGTQRREAEIRLKYRDDPIGRARALAGARFDAQVGDTSGLDPVLQQGLAEQRDAYVANQVAISNAQQELQDWNAAQREAAGGGSRVAQVNRVAAATYDKIREAGGRYAAELARIVALHEAGTISEEEMRDAVQTLSGEIDRAARAAEQLESAFSDTFTSILSGADSASDALSNLLSRLGDMALNAAFSGLFGGMFDGLGEFFAPKRATGGQVRAGVPYMVNENTPKSELFVPSQNGAILNVAQAQRALSGGSGGGQSVALSFSPVIDARGADAAAVARIEAQQRRMAAEFEGRVHQVLRAGKRHRLNRAWQES